MAWGAEGHRLVGYVADAELSPKARIEVRRIMKADSIASVANWMDEVRDTPEGRRMQRWHFITMKACGDLLPSCKNGNCATGRIEWARDVLRTGSSDEALTALRVLVHLTGDVHQPLHAADNGDYGGNGASVTNRMCVEFGATRPSACKLHTYWDSSLVKAALRDQSERDAAATWSASAAKLPSTDSDSAADWAVESNELARQTAYQFEGFACKMKRQSFAADEAYDAVGVATVKQQIVRAGRRLARTLNSVFD
ncbi:S1/P1 nuclease [Pelomonas sp. Root1237]|uniref:S1/P1 nuclease n=1 Tax=Pelomonas sp. Root1237 TaxID=1736434 RepID=UPI0006F6D248|nr:S1/P1 nuclease [Pelomonas sp. Root1237]